MTSIERDPTTQEPAAIGGTPVDRLLWGFPLFALCCEVFLAWLTYLERFGAGALVAAFLLFILIALAMLVVALVGIVFLFLGKLRRAAALLLAPLIVIAPFMFPLLAYEEIPILRYETFVFDLVRFHFTKTRYADVVDKLSPADRASRILFFDWGDEGSGSSKYWLVYDQSGEIALPDEERSQAWKDRAKQEKRYFSNERCRFEAHHLSGHFYSAANHCPD
jgi:hypothetical protein